LDKSTGLDTTAPTVEGSSMDATTVLLLVLILGEETLAFFLAVVVGAGLTFVVVASGDSSVFLFLELTVNEGVSTSGRVLA